jgi:hypothetical protein
MASSILLFLSFFIWRGMQETAIETRPTLSQPRSESC